MVINYFTKREEGDGGVCYFCEANLLDYLDSISEEYNQYDIQRGFVNNVFLEGIVDSVKENKFIPPIVLVLKDPMDLEVDRVIENGQFNILDGLQRTIRLKKLYEAAKFLEDNKVDISDLNGFKLRTYFNKNNHGTYLTESSYVLKAKEKSLSVEDFKQYDQWFEIWSGLDKVQQIEKMILLNAGHKSMDLKHQLELIFLTSMNIRKYSDAKCDYEYDEAKCEKDFSCIVYAKDISTRSFYSKKRKYDIHFTLFLDAIIALEKKEPFAIDQKSLVDLQANYLDYEIIKLIISYENNIDSLVGFFKSLDNLFCDHYGEKGLEFLGRESVVIGFFAALGNYLDLNKFDESLTIIENTIKKNINTFDIDKFENMKKQVDITAFNIGNIMKETVFYLTKSVFENEIITFNSFPVSNPGEYREFLKGLKNESE